MLQKIATQPAAAGKEHPPLPEQQAFLFRERAEVTDIALLHIKFTFHAFSSILFDLSCGSKAQGCSFLQSLLCV